MDATTFPRLIMHSVPASPVCPAHRVLSVDTGARPPPMVVEIDGRRCYVVSEARVSRRPQGRTSYGVVFVRFLDDGTASRFTAAVFNRKARVPAPLPGDPA